MNNQAFEAGKTAYKNGDFAGAIRLLGDCKAPGEVAGAVDHLLGNCLMKLGRFEEAATSYGDALRDGNYGHSGALSCNRGRALLAAGKVNDAIASLSLAVKDESYETPYKAYVALGNAYFQMGNIRDAGSAFRSAAIDDRNPDPSYSLRQLGTCFMQMNRAVDAVEAFRTALDFATPQADQNAIYADLGLAYVAANRMNEAVDAFTRATADGTYFLKPEAQSSFEAAKRAISAASDGSPSETDAFLAAAGYGRGNFDPLDPAGQSGEFIPSPESTGFFTVTEEDLLAQDKHERKTKRKKRHTGLKVFLVFFILLLLVAGAVLFGLYKGYGWPTQEDVVKGLFNATTQGSSIDQYVVSGMSDQQKNEIVANLPMYMQSEVNIDGVDRSLQNSTVLASGTLSNGGNMSYKISMVREGLGWKVSKVEVVYASKSDTVNDTTGGTTGTEAPVASTTDANATSTTDSANANGDTTNTDSTSTTTGTVENTDTANAQ